MDMEDFSIEGDGAKDTKSDGQFNDGHEMKDKETSNAEPDGPPYGFQFVLPFLDLSSRLIVERLNKPLREAVKDPFLWVDLKVEKRACGRLTNDILLKLVKRANGHLKSLFLTDAYVITDKTLSKISELNPGIERIFVSGCTTLNSGYFVSLVEVHSLTAQAFGLPGIRQVRLGGLHNISPEHLLRLRNALGVSSLPQSKESPIRRYYGNDQTHNEVLDKRVVDVELCPICKKVRLVYNCTNYKYGLEEACHEDDGLSEDEAFNDLEDEDYCRSCLECIPRCEECGTCIRTESYGHQDSLCGDLLCTGCWDDLPQCIVCKRPACSLCEKGYFPYGLEVACDQCIEKSMEFEGLDDGILSTGALFSIRID